MENFLTDEEFKNIFPFETPRHNQMEIIEKIIKAYKSGKKYVILSAPTGTGKSCIGYAVARYFGSSYILTSQKVLQDQYYKDFKIPFVLGRTNYVCKKNPSLNCELGACFRDPKRKCYEKQNGIKVSACPYIIARETCLNAPHSNLNYSYFLSSSRVSDFLGQKSIVVCDECHSLETELLKFCTIHIDKALIKYIGNLKIDLPKINETDASKCRWLCYDFEEKVRSEFLYLKSQLNSLKGMNNTKEFKKISSKHSILEKLVISIGFIKNLLEDGERIVVTQNKDFIEYKLLHCDKIFENTMGEFADKFLFMSATILNYKSFLKDLSINEKDVEYIECDSTFPVENRLIHYMPVGSMSFRSKQNTLPLMIKKIDQLLKENKDVKGIIHTVNYDIAEKIIDGLSFSDQSYRLLMPRGSDKQVILNAFYNSSKPYVLISPSLMEGIDLKEDLSRLCIICKMPYLNLADKWVSERMKESQEWYIDKACTNLVQMTGRSIRSEDDFAKTYILDSDFMNLAKNAINVFPKWWQESVTMN